MASDMESRIRDAIYGYQNGRYTSIRAAAAANDVDKSTLGRRLKGGLSMPQAREPQQLLSNKQEEMLKEWIVVLVAQGHHPTFSEVRELVVLISRATGGPAKVGNNWINRFLRRHPDIRSKVGRKVHVKEEPQDHRLTSESTLSTSP